MKKQLEKPSDLAIFKELYFGSILSSSLTVVSFYEYSLFEADMLKASKAYSVILDINLFGDNTICLCC